MTDAVPADERSTQTQTQTRTQTETRTRQPALWNVVLLDDDDHTYEYVIRMMQELFGHPKEQAYKIATAVDADGRAVCRTTHKELAELKRDQILAYGRDPLMVRCRGSMSSIIEPAVYDADNSEKPGVSRPS